MGKKIWEIKSTCKGCGNVFFYGKTELFQQSMTELKNAGSSLENLSSSALCCSGCAPAIFIPEKKMEKTVDLKKCPKCGSRALKTERVEHEV